MRLFILCTMLMLSTANPRRNVDKKNSAVATKSKVDDSGTTSGKKLSCGEYHLPLKQKFSINSETTEEDCAWTLRVNKDDTNIIIRCNVNLAESNKCRDASLQIFDGWRVKQKYCGKYNHLVKSSSTGLMVVSARAKTDKFTRDYLGTFSCEISSELKVHRLVKEPEEPPAEEDLPLPPSLSVWERIFSVFVNE
ncbi:uncharacterized protein [Palaemon carinicauda]|uniref:uncharacterized protein n=1 Tax=Palaemon carinicauda TaxID=392227 RepID=UPI0035B6A7AC